MSNEKPKIFWAKSDPVETIQEHTQKLLDNFEILKAIYPNLYEIDWDMLQMACEYHDLGKMNPKFQRKIKDRKKDETEIPHNYLSTMFIDVNALKKRYSKDEIKILINAIAYHHDRDAYMIDRMHEEVDALKEAAQHYIFNGKKYNHVRVVSSKFLKNDRISDDTDIFLKYSNFKGLLNRLDYAASGHIKVETQNDFLMEGLDRLHEIFVTNGGGWNDMQKYLMSHQEDNLVVIAQTGMGKTEGAFLWIGNKKGFFTLPIRTAINAIYSRLKKEIVPNRARNMVSLLHSDAISVLRSDTDIEDADSHFALTKQLAMPITVSTIDQIFKFAFKYKNFEPTFATLGYSKIVIDEIQMYSPELLATLVYGLKLVTKIGGKFAILTATFPRFVGQIMRQKGIEFKEPEKPFISSSKRHHICSVEESINVSRIIENASGKKNLVVCNQISKALEIYNALVESSENIEVHLLHSRFIKKDRQDKENAILADGQKNTEKEIIWVSTQIVEASLDIDFDILHTELSDLSGLFQRLGRCNRKGGKNTEEVNAYVYLGSTSQACSGVGLFIDEHIHKLSRDALLNYSGLISELEKTELIEATYKLDAVKQSEYYRKFIRYYDKLESQFANEMSKREVDKAFRGIESEMMIPQPVYDENMETIQTIVGTYQQLGLDQEMDKSKKRTLKSIELEKLNQYLVSIPSSSIKNLEGISDYVFLNEKYDFKYPVLDCEYSYEKGVELKKNKDLGKFL